MRSPMPLSYVSHRGKPYSPIINAISSSMVECYALLIIREKADDKGEPWNGLNRCYDAE